MYRKDSEIFFENNVDDNLFNWKEAFIQINKGQ